MFYGLNHGKQTIFIQSYWYGRPYDSILFLLKFNSGGELFNNYELSYRNNIYI